MNELFELVSEIDVLDFGKGNERSQKISFGRRLAQQRDRVIGNHRIVSAGKQKRISQWMLVPTAELPAKGEETVYIEHKSAYSHTSPHAYAHTHAYVDGPDNIHQYAPHTPGENKSIESGNEQGASGAIASSPGYEEF